MSTSKQRNQKESWADTNRTKENDRKTGYILKHDACTYQEWLQEFEDAINRGEIRVRVIEKSERIEFILQELRMLWWSEYYAEGSGKLIEATEQLKLLRELQRNNIVLEDSWIWYCIPPSVKRILGTSSSLPKVWLPEEIKDVQRRHKYIARTAAKTLFEADFIAEDVLLILKVWLMRTANSEELKLNDLERIVHDMQPWAEWWRILGGYTLESLKETDVFRRMWL